MLLFKLYFIKEGILLLHALSLRTDEKTSGVSVDSFRKAILGNLNNIEQKDIDKILFHLSDNQINDKYIRRYPYILLENQMKIHFIFMGMKRKVKGYLKSLRNHYLYVWI